MGQIAVRNLNIIFHIWFIIDQFIWSLIYFLINCYHNYAGFIEFIVDPSLTVMGDLLEKILMPNQTSVRQESDCISEERNLETGRAFFCVNIQIEQPIQSDEFCVWSGCRRDAGDAERGFIEGSDANENTRQNQPTMEPLSWGE